MNLTERQKTVLKGIAGGSNLKTIALEMSISHKTADFHKSAACRKLGLKSAVEIVHYGIARLGVPLLFAFLAVVPLTYGANPVNLGSGVIGWDRSSDDFLTNSLVYKFYASTNIVGGVLQNPTNAYMGTNISVVVTNLTPGWWYFSVAANQGGLESTNNQVLPYFVPVLAPRPPGKQFMISVQSTLNFTNWTDMGNFRAVLQVWP